MYELLHNKINSNYFIVNIKLKFPESNDNQMIHVNFKNNDVIFNYNNLTNKSMLKLKNKYISIIRKWIQNILDQYSLLYNSVLYITNLNYDTIRIFIYFNPLSYSNMDNKYAIYLYLTGGSPLATEQVMKYCPEKQFVDHIYYTLLQNNKDWFKPAKNSIRTADLYSSWFVTDNDLNPSTKGADLNLHRFKCAKV